MERSLQRSVPAVMFLLPGPGRNPGSIISLSPSPPTPTGGDGSILRITEDCYTEFTDDETLQITQHIWFIIATGGQDGAGAVSHAFALPRDVCCR